MTTHHSIIVHIHEASPEYLCKWRMVDFWGGRLQWFATVAEKCWRTTHQTPLPSLLKKRCGPAADTVIGSYRFTQPSWLYHVQATWFLSVQFGPYHSYIDQTWFMYIIQNSTEILPKYVQNLLLLWKQLLRPTEDSWFLWISTSFGRSISTYRKMQILSSHLKHLKLKTNYWLFYREALE